jgi:hypothetical protein
MAIAALNWAWSQQAPTPTAKLVLIALADHANGEGVCWPYMAKVAELAQVSERQVSRCIGQLEEAGLLTRRRTRKDNGELGRYVYTLALTTGHPRPVDHQTSTSGTTGHPRPVPPDTGVRSRTTNRTVTGTVIENIHPSGDGRLADDGRLDEFRDVYPRHRDNGLPWGGGSRQPTLARWRKLTAGEREAAIVGARHYAADVVARDAPVKHADGWLRERRWESYQAPVRVAARDGPDRLVGTEWTTGTF